MGNEAEFHFGKRRSREGLEFISGRKPTSFREKVARFENQHMPRSAFRTPPAGIEQPAQEKPFEPAIHILPAEAVMPAQLQAVDPLQLIYQEPILTTVPAPAQEDYDLPAPRQTQPESRIVLRDAEPKRTSVLKRIVCYGVAAFAAAVLVMSALFLLHNTPNIPANIRAKAGFVTYDVVTNPTFKLDKNSVTLASGGNLVYFVDNAATKAHFVVSQQKIPSLVQSDADYQQFLTDFDKYAEVDSKIGKAYFTRPANIGSDISVVVKTATTLLFIRGPGTTSDVDWTSLLGYLHVVK